MSASEGVAVGAGRWGSSEAARGPGLWCLGSQSASVRERLASAVASRPQWCRLRGHTLVARCRTMVDGAPSYWPIGLGADLAAECRHRSPTAPRGRHAPSAA